MEEKNITQLRELKKQLLNKALCLRDKLQNQEEGGGLPINFNIILPSNNKDHEPSKSLSTNYIAKLNEISSQVTDIVFEDVNKTWLGKNLYLYTTKVVTKTISFNLELTVDRWNLGDFKINNISCYFLKSNNYISEISPCIQKIIEFNNFSLLMSALSDYNEYNIIRTEILQSLKLKKYIRIEQCTEKYSGILIHVSSLEDTEKVYIIFHWTLKFLDLTWHIEHFFNLKSTNIGIEFGEENNILLKQFCKVSLTKNDLIDLWNKLCVAIVAYSKSTRTSDT